MLASGYIRGYLAGDIEPSEFVARTNALLRESDPEPGDDREGGGDKTLKRAQWEALRQFTVSVGHLALDQAVVLGLLKLDEHGCRIKKAPKA